MSFWTIFIVILFIAVIAISIALDGEIHYLLIIGYVIYVMYGPLYFMSVDIMLDRRQIFKKSPQYECYNHILFTDSLEREIPGPFFSPELIEYPCPYVPEFLSGINIDIAYRLDVTCADVEYNPLYTNEGNGKYVFMGTSIDEYTLINSPIKSISNYCDSTRVGVTLNAKWSRCFNDNERIIALQSRICHVPREQGQTFKQWLSLCDDKLDTLATVGMNVITYMSDEGKYRHYVHPDKKKIVSSEINSYLTQELPKVKRSINLRQDLYKENNSDSINVTKVEVSSVADGGLVADIFLEPLNEKRPVTVLYQYYTKAEDTKDAYKSDFVRTYLVPGQNQLQIFVEDGYDQFALVALMDDSTTYTLVKDNSSRFDLMLNLFDYDYQLTINDYTTLHYDNYYNSYLLVDHREGFWQKLFYSKYTNDVDWLTTILISITGLGVIALVVWFVIRKFKK